MRGTYAVPYVSRGSILGAAEAKALEQLIASDGSLSTGSFRDRFEQRFREHIGTRHALSVTSGTVALELAIHLLDLKEGDEVIVTPRRSRRPSSPCSGCQPPSGSAMSTPTR